MRNTRYNPDGLSSFELKPWNQHVLTKCEVATFLRLKRKMEAAVTEVHKTNKCKIEQKGKLPCEHFLRFETGIIHHYPNGYYI